MGSVSSARDLGVDQSVTTANVPVQTVLSEDPERRSDELTIRNAVSAADIAAPGALAWSNADTGSRGSITNLAEARDAGAVCRTFRTTRESYDGVAIFTGKTCMVSPGTWVLTSFNPI